MTNFWQKLFLWISFLVFLASLLLRQETAITQDLGRHLRLGEMIVAGGDQRVCALYKNCLTYTFPDYPFINHHWGSEVIFYFIHKFDGFRGIILVKTIILGLAFVITALHSASKGPAFGHQRPGLHRLVFAIVITFFSIQMMSDRLTTRPEIFGYLLFALLFFILDSGIRRMSLLLVFCSLLIILWVNLHISFVFGLILIWVWAISHMLKGRSSLCREDRPYRVLAIPAISSLVTILNPSGLRGALMPLTILKDYGYTIAENVTPFFLSSFRPLPEYWIYAFLVIATVGLLLFSSAKKNSFHLLTFLTFSLFPLLAVRHLPFFALVVPPILTSLISKRFTGESQSELFSVGIGAILIVLAFTNPVLLSFFKLAPFGLHADSRYDQATQFVKNHQLQGNMWNDYDIGSYLEWAIPEHKTFVDGRPEAFSKKFFQGLYIPMQLSRENWDIVVDRYQIQWAVVTLTESPEWFRTWWQMIQSHPNWKIVYTDPYAAILIKKDGANNRY